MKRYFFNILLAGTISVLPAGSFANNQPTSTGQFASLEDIPLPLMKNLQGYYQTKEQYIANILSPIRQSGRTKFSLDQQDIDSIYKKSSDDKRRQVLSQFVSFDYDFDGVVTRQDINNMMSSRNPSPYQGQDINKDVSRMFSPLLAYDANHDEMITYEEVRSVVPPISISQNFNSRDTKGLAELLKLDPNKDGTLTVDELETLARKTYQTIDKDGDGMLSADEVKPLGDIQRKLSELNRLTDSISDECKPFAQMPKDEKIVRVGVYEGDTISSVSIAGQAEETRIVSVYVEPGKDKIYLVASSFKPVIWKMSGATDRISHIVLAGPSIPDGTQNNDRGGAKVNAGVIGVPVTNLEFRHARACGLGSGYDPQFSVASDAVMQKLFGKKADVTLSQYKMLDLQIGPEGQLSQSKADTSVLQRLDKMSVPEGFDPATWRKSLRYSGGGISFEKADTIISEAKVQNYIILPAWAGISKLVHDGVLVPVNNIPQIPGMPAPPAQRDNAYKIVKEMAYYPAGLTGGVSTSFILGKGIKPPKGDIGHSCLVSEETGQQMAGVSSPRCRNN